MSDDFGLPFMEDSRYNLLSTVLKIALVNREIGRPGGRANRPGFPGFLVFRYTELPPTIFVRIRRGLARRRIALKIHISRQGAKGAKGIRCAGGKQQVASDVAQVTCHLQTCILANLLSVIAPLREIFIGIGAWSRVVPAMTPAENSPPVIGIPVGQGENARGAKLYIVHQLYLDAIYRAGGIPCPVPLHLDELHYREIFRRMSGLLLAGGEDIDPRLYHAQPKEVLEKVDPDRDAVEVMLARWAVEEKMPILGICRGHQLLNVALGGTLYQDIREEMGIAEVHDMRGKGPNFRQQRPHLVKLDPNSRIAKELGAVLWVNSLHHQAVAKPGQGLRVIGMSPEGVIEATELEDHPFAVTVQWHPEMLHDDVQMLRLFRILVEEARRFRELRPDCRC